jgi:hypothetical protein
MLSDNLLQFYADCFCNGNKDRAKISLNSQYNEIRSKDANMISFVCGAMFILILCLLYFVRVPGDTDRTQAWQALFAALDIYYLTWTVTFVIFSTGFCIQIFRMYSINYAFIFEID